jgi:uncharacterized membrane protein
MSQPNKRISHVLFLAVVAAALLIPVGGWAQEMPPLPTLQIGVEKAE